MQGPAAPVTPPTPPAAPPPTPPAAPTADTELSAFLACRDEPCPACRYNLRGLAAAACPECGEELQLRVNLAEPRLGVLIAALGGYWSTLGAAGALLVGMVVFSLAIGTGPGNRWAWLIPIFTFAAALAPGAALSTRAGRTWLRARSAPARLATAASGWLLLIAGFTWFMWHILTM